MWRVLVGLCLALVVAVTAGISGSGRSGGLWDLLSSGPNLAAPYVRPAPLETRRLALPRQSSGQADRTEWMPLVDRPWRHATTGWQVLADYDTPLRNYSFTFGAMVVAGEAFARGLATYPFSEIIYDLDALPSPSSSPLGGEGGVRGGQALVFQARVGITDDSKQAPPLPPDAGDKNTGTVRFLVYGDEFLLYESGVVRAGERSQEVSVSVEGLRQLRLVVDDNGDGSLGDYALWADPQLLISEAPPSSAATEAIAAARQQRAAEEAYSRSIERAALISQSQVDWGGATRLGSRGTAPQAGFDRETALLVMGNSRTVATLGYGGPQNGRLSFRWRWDDELGTLVDVTPSIGLADGRSWRLADMAPVQGDSPSIQTLKQPVASVDGYSVANDVVSITARFRPPDGQGVVIITLSMAGVDAALELGVSTEFLPLRSVRYLDAADGGLVLGDDVRFLTDRSHLYRGEAPPDGHTRRAPLEATKPALIWSDGSRRGILLAFYDYVPSPGWLSIRRDPGLQAASIGLELAATLGDFGPAGTAPPMLSIELIDGPVGPQTFDRYRRIVNERYPPLPLPERPQLQWGSWYVYGPAVTAAALLRQVELLATSFGDIPGGWQFLVDAGWHAQYGREDAELGTVDFEKFPGGVRAVADAAHARGMELMLYLGTGFVHDSPGNEGEWLGLRGLIERHPEWMIPFQRQQGPVRRFVLDYGNPEVRQYVGRVLGEFFTAHGADAILLDGLADAEGQLIPRLERDAPDGPPHPLLPTLDIYRLVREEADRHRPNAFVESGWLNPMAANPYAHVFRYADEIDLVDSVYPFGGFLQKLDYAIFSRLALGQRSYVGTSTGDPGQADTRWWLQAAAALGSHATLSFDLSRLNPGTTAALRSDLIALDAFKGATTFGPGLFPDTFATTRNGTTYLGVLNREPRPRGIQVALDPLGLSDGGSYTAFDPVVGSGRRITGDFTEELGPRSFRLLVLRREPGLLWTDSAATQLAAANSVRSITVSVRGPAQVPGFLNLAAPPPTSVQIDGTALSGVATPGSGTAYGYDEASGLLSVSYAHTGERRIEISW